MLLKIASLNWVKDRDPAVQFPAEARKASLLQNVQLWEWWDRAVTDHSPRSIAQDKNKLSYTSTPPYAFKPWTGTNVNVSFYLKYQTSGSYVKPCEYLNMVRCCTLICVEYGQVSVGSAIFWDITRCRVEILYRITTLHGVVSQKRADLIYVAGKAWNHAGVSGFTSICFPLSRYRFLIPEAQRTHQSVHTFPYLIKNLKILKEKDFIEIKFTTGNCLIYRVRKRTNET